MSYTLGEAARATGKSKPTIARAIRSGRISAARADDGSYTIDPAELHRVFPVIGNGTGTMKQIVLGNDTGDKAEHRDRLIQEQAETIRDLRTRFDASEEERRALQAKLTALITDQRPNRTLETAGPPRTLWDKFLVWRRWPR